jgi:NAD(P)-dependent dehydrogenase (short-subunit alcohol dehydrogenase family)
MPDQRIAIVTGASRGIGRGIAQGLARAGYAVVVNYASNADAAREVREQIQSAGGRAEPVRADISVAADREELVAATLRTFGRIDLLVNNAGFSVAPAGAEESSIAQAQAIFDTNFFGMTRMIRAVVPHMRRQGSGRIINIGSVLGFLPMPYGALYAASKHAVEGYSESLDHELRTRGIRVSVIEPAYTKTQFDANFLEPDAKLDEYREIRAAVAQKTKALVDAGDKPGVVADAVLQAALAAHPKLRYTAGGRARGLRFLRRFAPARLLDAGIRKDLQLDALPMGKPS